MKQDLVFAIPGDLQTRTGGYAYDRRIIAELTALGWTVRHLELPDGFPKPNADDLAAAKRQFDDLQDGTLVLIDGLTFGAPPGFFAEQSKRLGIAALVHHPLCLETGLDDAVAKALYENERAALVAANAIIVTSPETARELARLFAITPDRITVAPPGTDRPGNDRTRHKEGDDAPVILSVGTLVPRKGHDRLIEALSGLKDLAWTCRIVGGPDRDADHATRLARMIGEADLDDRIVLVGEVADTASELETADLFALATHYEGYGMAFTEALAAGLPIVGTRTGAVADNVPESAGILVEPGDTIAFREALRGVLSDPSLRTRYAKGARAAAQNLPIWEGSASRMSDTLKTLSR